jgi:hypothetical protein
VSTRRLAGTLVLLLPTFPAAGSVQLTRWNIHVWQRRQACRTSCASVETCSLGAVRARSATSASQTLAGRSPRTRSRDKPVISSA